MCTTCMLCVEPCRHEDIRHASFQLHPRGGLPTERCLRLIVLSLFTVFVPGVSWTWKFMWRNNAGSTRPQQSKPSHLCPSTYPPRAVMHWPWQFGTVVGFLFVCVHAFSSHHFSHVKGFPQESSGVIVVFLFLFLIILQGIEHASRKKRTCEY